MTFYYVQLKRGNKIYKDKVSTAGCSDVADLKGAIKIKFSPDLDSYATHRLTLLQPGGTTEIDPGVGIERLNELNVGPSTPLVVIVDERHAKVSSKRYIALKGMSFQESCIKYLNALAIQIFLDYDFHRANKYPSMSEVLAAKDGRLGEPQNSIKGDAWWDYKKDDGIQFTTIPLHALLSVQQWDTLKELNHDTLGRIYHGQMPRTSRQKPFLVLPHSKYTSPEYVCTLKCIAEIVGIVPTGDDLVVMDESNLS